MESESVDSGITLPEDREDSFLLGVICGAGGLLVLLIGVVWLMGGSL